jgi:hypothetical protein
LVGLACAVALTLAAGAVHAAQEEIPGGWIDARGSQPALADLARSAMRLASAEDVWVGYTFALREGVHVGCDVWKGHHMSFGSGDMHLYFEDDELGSAQNVPCDEPFGVFLRIDDDPGEVAEARLISLERAEERLSGPVVWAGQYTADASVEYLSGAVLEGVRGAVSTSRDKVRERLLAVVAIHDSSLAEGVVFAAVEPDQPRELRESAVFWVTRVADDQGVDRLLDLAHNDADSEIRQQSIFWLGQLAGDAATAHLTELAESDPDTEVRQSAVFALSQSEDDAAIEALIRIVRAHQNPEVVRSSLFWLGQSGDPRALALFEELLLRRRN